MVEHPAVNRNVVGSSPTRGALPAQSVQFWVYILQNPAGRFYIGSSANLDRRVADHNSDRGAKTFTHKNGPWTLVWEELHPTRAAAIARERQIKKMKSAKWMARRYSMAESRPVGINRNVVGSSSTRGVPSLRHFPNDQILSI